MRKIKITLLIAIPVLTLLVGLFLTCNDGIALKPGHPLIGNSYHFNYYPVEQSNQEQQKMTKYMNSLSLSGQFVNDSIFILRSSKGIENTNWSVKGDSINLGGIKYLLTSTGQSFLLISTEEKLELVPAI